MRVRILYFYTCTHLVVLMFDDTDECFLSGSSGSEPGVFVVTVLESFVRLPFDADIVRVIHSRLLWFPTSTRRKRLCVEEPAQRVVQSWLGVGSGLLWRPSGLCPQTAPFCFLVFYFPLAQF